MSFLFAGPRLFMNMMTGVKLQLFCMKARVRLPLHMRLWMCMSSVVNIFLISRRKVLRFQRMELTLWRSTLEVMTEGVQVSLEHR